MKGVHASKVLAQDPLNGVEQELIFKSSGDGINIQGIMVKDYPIMIKIIHL